MAAASGVYVRPLKKPRLGPPDVYFQDSKQKEDDLSESNVKRGFVNQPAISNEYGSAKELFTSINASKFATQYNGVLLQKEKNNSFLDTTQKKLQVNTKENFWPVTFRSRQQVTAWLNDLAKTKPLSQLGRKVPIFNKKEDIFSSLCEQSVPMNRAAWFLKVTSSYQNSISESKMKKRAATDPSQEWTCALTKYMKDQLNRLVESYGQPYAGVGNQRPSPDVELALKQWNYSMRLSDWLMQENLLDKQEFLKWLIELMERLKNRDDALMRHVLPLILKHLNLITSTQTLSRPLAVYCIRKLTLLNMEAEQLQCEGNAEKGTNDSRPMSPMRSSSPVLTALEEYKECQQHKSLVTILCGIIQAITLCCPTALVWSAAKMVINSSAGQNGDHGTRTSVLGSPLDRLPCAPSFLLNHVCNEMSSDPEEREDYSHTLASLQQAEDKIQQRGKAAERQWLSASHQESESVGKTLAVLDILDKTDFFKTDSSIPLQIIYKKIFPTPAKALTKSQQAEDHTNALLLCDWSVTDRRHGMHRALVCTRLLLQRQNEINDESDDQLDDDAGDNCSDDVVLQQPFQDCLMDFLDKQAVKYGDAIDALSLPSFRQLVFLFGELIRNRVFSHNKYMCALIARGDIGSIVGIKDVSNDRHGSVTVEEMPIDTSSLPSAGIHEPSTADDTNVIPYETALDEELLKQEHDLQKLLNADKDLSGFFVTLPSSRKSSITDDRPCSSGRSSQNLFLDTSKQKAAGHRLFALHFPLPVDPDGSHESKQRSILLYGVGKQRKEGLKQVKELCKEATEIVLDVDDMAPIANDYDTCLNDSDKEKKSEYEKRIHSFYRKLTKISIHDQYTVANRCQAILGALKAAKESEYGVMLNIPSVYQLAFVCNLYELCGDVQGLLEFIGSLIHPKETGYSGGLVPQSSSVKGTLPLKLLLVVSIVYRYFSCLLTSAELTSTVFRGSLRTVENIADPGVCTSTERAVLKLLYNLYTSCEGLRTQYSDIFSTACTKIKQSICTNTTPSNSSLLWEAPVLSDYLTEPRHMQLDPIWQMLLSNDRPAELYSFVCSVILNICSSDDQERVYDISVLCAETTSHISLLSGEWLGVVKALCCSSNRTLGFNDLISTININESRVYSSISTFVAVMISRCCFTLGDFLKHVVQPSLQAALSNGDGDLAKDGAKLTCHIVLKLFDETVDRNSTFHAGLPRVPFSSSPDHSLLTGALDNAELESVLPVIKLLLLLSNADSSLGPASGRNSGSVGDEIFLSLFNMNSSNYTENSSSSCNLITSSSPPHSSLDTLSDLSTLAGHVLCNACRQRWIQLKFLQTAEKLLTREMLLDPLLKVKQARKVIRLCSSSSVDNITTTLDNEDFEAVTNRLCEDLDHWSLQSCFLELQLMISQASKEDISRLLNAVARSVMSSLLGTNKSSETRWAAERSNHDAANDRHTLIGPLIAKLPVTVQGRILKAAAEKMERGKWWSDREAAKVTHESQQSMFTLILSCLRGQDDNKNVFLNSLHTQLLNFCNASSEEKFPSTNNGKRFLLEALHLRLNLVGAMFDIIQKATQSIYDWTVTLFRLVVCGVVVDGRTSPFDSMFTDLLDMIVVLLNTVQLNDSHMTQNQAGAELQKYGTLVRRLRKELVNRPNTLSIRQCEQLLPIGSPSESILTTEASKSPDVPLSGSSTPLNKHGTDHQLDEQSFGLKVSGIQSVSPWDLLEDHKNPAPLSWAAFGAVKIERKPLKYLDEARSLLHHTHQKRMPFAYFVAEPTDKTEDSQDNDDANRANSAGTPTTPFLSPVASSPGSGGGALAQLLASVRSNTVSSPRELEMVKQLSSGGQRSLTPDAQQQLQSMQLKHLQNQRQAAAKRKRPQRQPTPQGNQMTGNLTINQVQQKQIQLMLQQQQQQQQQPMQMTHQVLVSSQQQPRVAGGSRTTTPEAPKPSFQAMLKTRSLTPVSMQQQPQTGVSLDASMNPIMQLQHQLARHQQNEGFVNSDQLLQVSSDSLPSSSSVPLNFTVAPANVNLFDVNTSSAVGPTSSFDFNQQQQQQPQQVSVAHPQLSGQFTMTSGQVPQTATSQLHQLLQGAQNRTIHPQPQQQPRFQQQHVQIPRSLAQVQSMQRSANSAQRQISNAGNAPRLQTAPANAMATNFQRQLSAPQNVVASKPTDLQQLQQRSNRPQSTGEFQSAQLPQYPPSQSRPFQ